MAQRRRKRIPKTEIRRCYVYNGDPNPNMRIFPCDFEYDEECWN